MSQRYGLQLSRQERRLFEAWSRNYPIEAWERQRNQRIACVMGWSNPFVGAADLRRCPAPFTGKGRND
jgi:deoxyribonuclease-1